MVAESGEKWRKVARIFQTVAKRGSGWQTFFYRGEKCEKDVAERVLSVFVVKPGTPQNPENLYLRGFTGFSKTWRSVSEGMRRIFKRGENRGEDVAERVLSVFSGKTGNK